MPENERLKVIRKSLKFTQQQFADSLDMKQGSYSDVERGKAGISSQLLMNLIRQFKVNPVWLCEGNGEMFIGGEQAQQLLTGATERPVPENSLFENPVPTKDQISELEFQHDYLENLKSILDFITKKS